MLGAKVWELVVACCSREQRVPRLECACLNTHTKRKADLAKGEAALAFSLETCSQTSLKDRLQSEGDRLY